MSKPKYLYIDDELKNTDDESVEAVRDGFNDVGLIQVDVDEPKDFKSQKKELLEKLKDYDGIILDLRLDQNMKLNVSYNAPAIAQELRTAVPNPDDHLKPCPIILCSTDERMRATYDADQTSHDLFDYKFLKGSEPDWERFSKKLKSLADGYNWLRDKKRSFNEILSRQDLTGVDLRIAERFEDPDNQNVTIYDYANFIIKEVFHHPGPLIKERVVASRLGIDIEGSGESWITFRDNLLYELKYSGVFSSGWDRWWSDKVTNFFKKISGNKRLGTLNAQDRVDIISSHFKIEGLKAASPIDYCISSKFWTICEASKRPLDPLEGFKVFESTDLKGWQEPKYLSFNAIAVEGLPQNKGLRPQRSELERIQLMKENLSKK